MPESIASQYDLTQFNSNTYGNGFWETIPNLLSNPAGFWEGQIKGGDAARTAEQLTREYNEALERERWQRETAYNSPIQQMARLREAGLNPHLAYGNGTSTTGQASSSAGSNPIKPGGPVPRVAPLEAMESFIRIRREAASLEEQEVRNEYLRDRLDDEDTMRNARIYAQDVVNSFLWHDELYRNGLLYHQNEISKLGYASAYQGLLEATSYLVAAGATEEQVQHVLNECMPGDKDYQRRGSPLQALVDLAQKELKASHAGLDAQISEDEMSKVLSSIGLHEGDPAYQRLTAMLGVGQKGQAAITVTKAILDEAMKIFGAQQTAVGNAVRNAYQRSLTRRNEWLPYRPTFNIETGELFGY